MLGQQGRKAEPPPAKGAQDKEARLDFARHGQMVGQEGAHRGPVGEGRRGYRLGQQGPHLSQVFEILGVVFLGRFQIGPVPLVGRAEQEAAAGGDQIPAPGRRLAGQAVFHPGDLAARGFEPKFRHEFSRLSPGGDEDRVGLGEGPALGVDQIKARLARLYAGDARLDERSSPQEGLHQFRRRNSEGVAQADGGAVCGLAQAPAARLAIQAHERCI